MMGCMLHNIRPPVKSPRATELEHKAAKDAWWAGLTAAEQKLWKAGEKWQSGEKPLCTDQKAFTKEVQEFLVRDRETAQVCELTAAVFCCLYRKKLWTLARLGGQSRSCTCAAKCYSRCLTIFALAFHPHNSVCFLSAPLSIITAVHGPRAKGLVASCGSTGV
jgi:hypothetical protein